jgi:hypothetical protein
LFFYPISSLMLNPRHTKSRFILRMAMTSISLIRSRVSVFRPLVVGLQDHSGVAFCVELGCVLVMGVFIVKCFTASTLARF